MIGIKKLAFTVTVLLLACTSFAQASDETDKSAPKPAVDIKPTLKQMAKEKPAAKPIVKEKADPQLVLPEEKPGLKLDVEEKPAPKSITKKEFTLPIEDEKPAPKPILKKEFTLPIEDEKPAPKPISKKEFTLPAEDEKPAPKPISKKEFTLPIEDEKPAPKPIVEEKPAPKPVAKKKPAPKPIVEENSTPKPVAEEPAAPKQMAEEQPDMRPMLDDKPAAEHILCITAAEGDEDIFLNSIPDDLSIDLNRSCDEEGHTPLQFATSGGFVRIVDKLLNMGAKIDSTSLLSAIHNNNLEIVQLFISKGVELCIPMTNNTLGYAASQRAETAEMRKLLLEAEEKNHITKDLIGVCEPKGK